jgi:hypothetical protein
LLSLAGMTARQTARGIGIRALILIAGIVLVGFWLISLAFKIAGAAIHLLLWIGLILVVAGAVAVVARRVKRRL